MRPAAPARPANHAHAPPSQLGAGVWIPFSLLLVWMLFEFVRPPNPLGIPLVISIALCSYWVFKADKQWCAYSYWWIVLLAVMVLATPFAPNAYSAYMATRGMAILILCICLPLQSMVTSVRHLQVFAYAFLLICVLVGAWAAAHGGYGPSGAAGSQDENYIAALMGMAIPFAYFSVFAERRLVVRGLLVAAIVIFLAAIALGRNPSRGGFVGLCVVGLYCLSRSPRKFLGAGLLGVMGIALLVIAGPAFWAEIETSADYQSGTGDVRLEIWKAGLRMWGANPFFGVGPGNFRWVIEDYQTAAQFAKFGRSLGGSIVAHSFFIEMVAELGLVGLVATAMLTLRTWQGLGTVRDSLPTRGTTPSSDALLLRYYADAIRGSILAVLVNGVFLSLFYYSNLWLLLALGSAVPHVYAHLARGAPMPAAVPPNLSSARPHRSATPTARRSAAPVQFSRRPRSST